MRKSILPLLLLFSTVALAQSWSILGTGSNPLNGYGDIKSICVDAAGNVFAAGGMYNSNSNGPFVAKWNGTTWSELGTLNVNGVIETICSDAKGNIYAAGYFKNSNGKYYVAKWDGKNWSELGTGANALNANYEIMTTCSDKAGNIYAAGYFTKSGNNRYVAKWDGTSWSELGTGSNALNATDKIYTICADEAGNIYAAGDYSNLNSSSQSYVAKWNGTNWSELGSGNNVLSTNNVILTICSDKAGNIYAAGAFTISSGNYSVAKWNGTNWSKLGSGSNAINANDFIFAICSDAAGNIYAAGDFTNSHGYRYVAKWNGTNWTEVGSGKKALNANSTITTMVINSGGLYVAYLYGYPHVAKYGANDAINSGFNDKTAKSDFQLYPNPTNSSFTIQHSTQQKEELTIYNVLGDQIYNDRWLAAETQKTIDLASLPKGLYIVRIGDTVQKVVKE